MRNMTLHDLRRVRSAARRAARAHAELRRAILAAHEAGESYRDIAEYADLSHQRVHQIVAEARAERTEREAGDGGGAS
jgi:DNA-directed RNA polymerase specialized sigma24 family protein